MRELVGVEQYLMPNGDDLFDRLGEVAIFSRMDMKNGYHQIHIKEGDEEKTTCMMPYGSYEFMVIPFNL